MNAPKTKPLTKAQRAALALAATVDSVTNIGGTRFTVKTQEAWQLTEMGYLLCTYTGPAYGGSCIAEWEITDAGRAALLEAQQAALLAHYRAGDVAKLVEVAARQIEQESEVSDE